jgi:ABC-type sugar transport system ATPase subunit
MSSVLEFKNISKYFPGVKALDDICFKAYGGEVLAFLGENGAGKSTLLKVLNGDYQPTKGEYLLTAYRSISILPMRLFRKASALFIRSVRSSWN